MLIHASPTENDARTIRTRLAPRTHGTHVFFPWVIACGFRLVFSWQFIRCFLVTDRIIRSCRGGALRSGEPKGANKMRWRLTYQKKWGD